jgi:hypothetical protein
MAARMSAIVALLEGRTQTEPHFKAAIKPFAFPSPLRACYWIGNDKTDFH